MADVIVPAGDVSSGRITLVAGEVTTVTFADNVGGAVIISDGAAPIYCTVDGSVPAVDGTHCFEMPAQVSVAERSTNMLPDVVSLISDGTPSVRVEKP